ncbi:MarR family winged helix-turn-helix transcriptional regulator [Novosphingobium sp. Chol11]|uniref:MarR family winged helix-turn-helix transcriptional regulator n=1 Tax=Novosphingobium sp. Chol11 TaxID=1385763 RepID=UPI0025D70283|nr:MarR family winged helix-turn-helix transcriptional regulator [Novosphingobium sp. Chol11]
MTMPSAVTILTWARLVRASAKALNTAELALKQAGLPPLEWYELLAELQHKTPIRPRDLQGPLHAEQYSLSRLIARTVRAGLVLRRPCPGDARGHTLELTEAGTAMRAAMWPVYGAAIEQALGTRLTEDERLTLAGLLQRLV